jgi:uncharacterized phage protein (TIGR01671 family)
MREIEFRGKREDNGKWIYGNIRHDKFKSHENYYISYLDYTNLRQYRVDSDTVGQYTGLTDSKGNKVFEGDIVDFTFFYYGETEIDEHKRGVIAFENYSLVFKVSETEKYYFSELSFDSESDIEVIGNKWDNPELLTAG